MFRERRPATSSGDPENRGPPARAGLEEPPPLAGEINGGEEYHGWVEYLEYHAEEWQKYWRLYCLQRLAVGNRQKLYESDSVSLVIGPAGTQ